MARGGARPGSGRKPWTDEQRAAAKARREAALSKPIIDGPAPKVFAEPKSTTSATSITIDDLRELEAISKRYATNKGRTRTADNSPFRLPVFPKEAVPENKTMAMDNAIAGAMNYGNTAWMGAEVINGVAGEGLVFLGYSILAEMAQRPEFRVMSETIADDATRKWIDFDVIGDERLEREKREKDPEGYEESRNNPDDRKKRAKETGKLEKIKALRDDQMRLGVKDRMYEQCRNDGFFGRSHLFLEIHTDGEPSDSELAMPIGDGRDKLSQTKVTKNSFKAMRTIEPVWTYPLNYNANNPLRDDWYNPQIWYVMGKEIHGSRLQTFIGHPVPDILKPAYAFGGLSLTQMAKPYVDIWLQTRQSVADLIHSFSVMVLMTDMAQMLQPNNVGAVLARAAMFNMLRDNNGLYVLNKNTEDFKNVSASLSGLHELQAQAQEHMASVHRIPLVKFTGIQPSGLNASSEGEIKVYDDTIMAYQSRFIQPNLTKIINFEQLSLFGEIDPEITFHFEPLREMTQAEKGQKQKDDADRDQKYVDMGAIAPGEVRKIIVDDPELPYTGLDPEDVPDLMGEEMDGLQIPGAHPDGGEGDDKDEDSKGGGANDAAIPFVAGDGEWREGDHPRAPDGKFGAGSGGGGKSPDRKASVNEYVEGTSSASAYNLNPVLRRGGKLDERQQEVVSHLDSMIEEATPTKSPQVVYRAAPKGTYESGNYGTAGAHQDRAFISTSGDYHDVAGYADEGDGEVVYEIHLPAGIKYAETNNDDRTGYSEKILPRGGVFTVAKGKSRVDGVVKLNYHGPRDISGQAVDENGGAADAEWKEGDHPRAPNGEFGSGGGGGGKKKDTASGARSAVLKVFPEAAEHFKNADFHNSMVNRFNERVTKAGGKALSPDEYQVMRQYMGYGSVAINRPLRVGGGTKEHQQVVELMDAGLRKLPKYDGVATRGLNLPESEMKRFLAEAQPGKTIKNPAYSSAAVGDKVAKNFSDSNVRMTIKSNGEARHFSMISAFGKDESEVIFPRNTELKITSVKTKGGKVHIQAEAVPTKGGAKDQATDEKKGDGDLEEIAPDVFILAQDEARFEESKHPRDQDGQFSSTGGAGGGGSSDPDPASFKSKKDHIGHLLSKGTTPKEVMQAMGWPSVSMPQQAAALGVKLEKYKEDGVTKYKSRPMTPEEQAEVDAAKAAKKAARGPSAGKRGRAAADPETWSLFEFLASKGGIKPTADLQSIFGNKRGPFVPGFGPLMRPGGISMEDALIFAKENSYVFDPNDIQHVAGAKNEGEATVRWQDLQDMISKENSGDKQYKITAAPQETKVDAEEESRHIIDALHREMAAVGGKVDPALEDRVAQIIQKEGETDVLAAYERAVMEDHDRYEGELDGRRAADIQSEDWDVYPDSASEYGEDPFSEWGEAGSSEPIPF